MFLTPFTAPLLGLAVGVLVVGIALVFWAMIQNWMADVIHRAQSELGPTTHVLQSALVVLDRVMVTGQRVVMATGHTVFKETTTDKVVVHEEVRQIDVQALPRDVLEKLDSGSMTYEVSNG